jgi:hypothetical protein
MLPVRLPWMPQNCQPKLQVVAATALLLLAVPGCGAKEVTAAKPAPNHGYVDVPRAPDRAARAEPVAAAPLGAPVDHTGEIRRHPDAGTKMEMITGRYHLYVGSEALWLEPSATVGEADFDAVAGKQVRVTLRKRDDAAVTSNPDNVQRPVDGLPARTVYVVVALAVLK